MKIKYDPADDILLIILKDVSLTYGEEVTPKIIAHYSEDGELAEIEVLDASQLLTRKEEIFVPSSRSPE